jgi:predicted metal-dependent phosphoesterase TrpH
MIDLHCHSTCSDGSESPQRVVELAVAAGLSAVALTDHDGLSGLAEAAKAAEKEDITLLPGCEVSCRFSPGTMHVLCYYVQEGDGPLQSQLERLRRDRVTRNERLITRLNELGIELSLEDVEREAGGGTLGRPHFAAALVEKGAAETYQGAFDELLGKGGPAYIPKAFISAEDTIAAAKGSHALPVLAHPLSLGLGPVELESLLASLTEAGLVGIECFYGRYSPEEREGLFQMARRHGLVATGGSDFHGTFKPDLQVGTGRGDLEVPDDVLDQLEDKRSSL